MGIGVFMHELPRIYTPEQVKRAGWGRQYESLDACARLSYSYSSIAGVEAIERELETRDGIVYLLSRLCLPLLFCEADRRDARG
jgi:hypothetical protein